MNPEKKNCDYCGEEIKASTRRCPFCGSLLKSTGYKKPETSATEGSNFIIVGKPYEYKEDVHFENHKEDINYAGYSFKPLNNGLKVFLTVISSVIPGFGQLIGIIIAVIFLNSDIDSDRRSFGISLLIASSVMFLISFLCFFVIILAMGSLRS